MAYTVQIVETRVLGEDSGSHSVTLPGRYPTIELAEEAGHAEVTRLRGEGKRTFYNILDQDGQPIGPTGPPDIPEGYGAM
jgi:hypothetical protein